MKQIILWAILGIAIGFLYAFYKEYKKRKNNED